MVEQGMRQCLALQRVGSCGEPLSSRDGVHKEEWFKHTKKKQLLTISNNTPCSYTYQNKNKMKYFLTIFS